MAYERDRSIDMLKVLLVVGMILCHCIMLLKIYGLKSYIVSEYFNVITFPGFLFCFGYAVSIAYLTKDKKIVSKKIIKNCVRMLIAFYISGLGYEFLINKNFSIHTILDILILNRMPGYSEFLAGFFVLNLFTLVFFNQLKKVLASNFLILTIIVLTLIATKVPYNKVPTIQFGLLFGSTKFSSFPIIQYFGYYLLGAYFQKHRVRLNYKFIITSILCSLVFLQFVFSHHAPPLRFPPSLRWIVGAAGVLYAYYGFSIWVSNHIKKSNPIYLIGEKPLYFLVLSNLLIFAGKGILNLQINILICIIISILIIGVIYIFVLFKTSLRQHNFS